MPSRTSSLASRRSTPKWSVSPFLLLPRPLLILTFLQSELLTKPDLVLAQALGCSAEQADVEALGKILRKMLSGGTLMMELIEIFMRREIDMTISAGTLFRGNTFSVFIMSAHSRNIGIEFMRGLLAPLIEETIAAGLDYELNPAKVRPPCSVPHHRHLTCFRSRPRPT